MPALTPLITAADLRNALRPATYLAIFDYDNSGDIATVDGSDQVALVLRRAHARVVSRVGVIYNKIPDGTDTPNIPELLKDAELNYAIGISFDAAPEYTKAYGHDPQRKAAYDQAKETMELLQEAILLIVDFPPEPKPMNSGGAVLDTGGRTFISDATGNSNRGDW
jgi:hypothetical protein